VRQFLSCRFIDCTIRYKGGAYAIENRGFEGTIQLALAGSAQNTAALLRSLVRFPGAQTAVADVLGFKSPGVTQH
jgi:hypothetical protein